MQTIFSGALIALFLCFGLTACGESELEKQRREYNLMKEQSSARIDSLEQEVGSSQAQLVTLQAELDSLNRFEMILQEKNKQLSREMKKYRAMAEERRRLNVKLQKAIAMLQEEKEADEAKIDRLIVESDSLTAALRDQINLTRQLSQELDEANKDLDEANKNIERTKAELDQAKNAVRVVVGTENRLKEAGFLETGRRFFRKGYMLVHKPGDEDSQVKILAIGEQLALDPDQKLKELIGRSGKLKKEQDYMVEMSAEGVTHITIINDILRGEAVLVVVD